MLSMFREGGPGAPVSMRRVLAFFFAILSIPLGIIAIPYGAWQVFIPFGVCVLACLLLLFFTTWADITEIIKAAKEK